MAQQDPRNFVYSSDYPMAYFVFDKVVQVTVPASSGSTVSQTLIVPHGLDFIPMPVGYWSNDKDFTNTNDIGTELYGGNYKEVQVVADATNFYVTARKVQNAALTFYVHLWAYMPPDANGHAPATSDTTNCYFNTDFPYLEIYMAGAVDSPSSGIITINHGLGYTPYCRLWIDTTYNGNPAITTRYTTNWQGDNYGGIVDNEKMTIEPVYGRKLYYHIYTAEVQQP